MSELPKYFSQILTSIVPASFINEIACFAFYDNHPRDNKQIDITICTKRGEVREYYQRELLYSLQLEGVKHPLELRILRNSACELFYVVSTDKDLIVLSRKNKLEVHQSVPNVESFEVFDSMCSGSAYLKIRRKDDAVPLILDDNFEYLQTLEMSETFTELDGENCAPIMTHLQQKLTEAKYSVKCNEKSLKEFLELRQLAAFSMYKKIHPNLDDSAIKEDFQELAGALKLKMQTPWFKSCNSKIIIAFIVCNENQEPLENVHVLLHGTTRPALVYTTKLFERTTNPPFWFEDSIQTVKSNIETAVAVTISLKELKCNVPSMIEFNGEIFYTSAGKECHLPIGIVSLSALDIMGEEFDVLASDKMDSLTMLARLASTEKTDILLQYIKNSEDQNIFGMEMFTRYLNMELVSEENIVIHRVSPYHVLYGVMIIRKDHGECHEDCLAVSVYARSSSQVLALLHYIHDAIPLTIIATTPNYKIVCKHQSDHNEQAQDTASTFNFTEYIPAIIDRSTTILEYLDSSMIKMGESKNPTVLNKVGSEIDFLAGGIDKYLEFRAKMLEKAYVGIGKLLEMPSDVDKDSMMDTD